MTFSSHGRTSAAGRMVTVFGTPGLVQNCLLSPTAWFLPRLKPGASPPPCSQRPVLPSAAVAGTWSGRTGWQGPRSSAGCSPGCGGTGPPPSEGFPCGGRAALRQASRCRHTGCRRAPPGPMSPIRQPRMQRSKAGAGRRLGGVMAPPLVRGFSVYKDSQHQKCQDVDLACKL